eukprot:m.76896 g.76896  ORF g.76896 m.76896 type:complete len:395 (-) comp14442_c2_seq16:54-1238(-)
MHTANTSANALLNQSELQEYSSQHLDAVLLQSQLDKMKGAVLWAVEHFNTPTRMSQLTWFLQSKMTTATDKQTTSLNLLYFLNDYIHHCLCAGFQGRLDDLHKLSPSVCFNASRQYPQETNTVLTLWEQDQVISPGLSQQLRGHIAGATPPVGVEPPSVLPAPSMAVPPPTLGLTQHPNQSMPLAPMGPVPPANLANRPPKYFELPAALMMDQISDEDRRRDPLCPSRILPKKIAEPTPAMKAALEEFFGEAKFSRNEEGWEEGALDEHYRRKRNHLRERRRRSRSRSRSPSPTGRRRTPPRQRDRDSPPARQGFGQSSRDDVGDRLMRGMGWSGGGLGRREQGRDEPVQAAEPRSAVDKYRGIGTDANDPFQMFRKSKADARNAKLAALTTPQ